MKIKTWEKIYWGIIVALVIFMIVAFHNNTNPNNFVIEDGEGVKRSMTVTEAYLGIFILFSVFGSLIWLIARYFVNKDKKD
ncbi:MAG: hypothetical protein GBAus27B_000110 [Mycoplasmataceae bacterium]|nr:MAG: hypothetical protein GBAus27B_000110 [Mycoplasmataceae bacterium]